MTPRDLSTATVIERLMLMRRMLDVLDQVGELAASDVDVDLVRTAAAERAVAQLVDLASDINAHVVATTGGMLPVDVRSSFMQAATIGMITPELAEAISPSVGLRNILVHEYGTLDRDRFVAALPMAREQFTTYIRQVGGWIAGRS